MNSSSKWCRATILGGHVLACIINKTVQSDILWSWLITVININDMLIIVINDIDIY